MKPSQKNKKRSFTNQLDDVYINATITALTTVYDQKYIRPGESRITHDPPNELSYGAAAYPFPFGSYCDQWAANQGGELKFYFVAKESYKIRKLISNYLYSFPSIFLAPTRPSAK